MTYRSAPITNQTCARTTHALCMPTWGDIPAHAPACLILITAARVNTSRPRFTLASSSSRWRMVHDCIMSLYVLCVGISVWQTGWCIVGPRGFCKLEDISSPRHAQEMNGSGVTAALLSTQLVDLFSPHMYTYRYIV